MKKNNIHVISSTLKTVASEQLVTAQELNEKDKPLEEILNAEIKKEDTKQSKRD
jgi:hypothetical protein